MEKIMSTTHNTEVRDELADELDEVVGGYLAGVAGLYQAMMQAAYLRELSPDFQRALLTNTVEPWI
jgi:hypothetical protein